MSLTTVILSALQCQRLRTALTVPQSTSLLRCSRLLELHLSMTVESLGRTKIL